LTKVSGEPIYNSVMLCSICKEKPATVHLTQIVGDKMQKLDLCEDCAKAKGVNDPGSFALADLMLGLGASQEIEQAGGGVKPSARAADFHAGGFQKVRPARLPGMLQRLLPRAWKVCSRRCTRARGTRQGAGSVAQSREQADRLKSLQKKLAKAIKEEDFEQAASCAMKSNK
jgi:protein arginine kinase activator